MQITNIKLKIKFEQVNYMKYWKNQKTLFNVITQFFNDVRSKYNLVPTSNPSGVIHKLKNKLNKIIKLLVLTNY